MMNFLSHYYFERHTDNPYLVLGMVLPDLIKNADKSWNIHPQKNEALFQHSTAEISLLKGWKNHLEVDRIFHNSSFFRRETALLKQFLLPALAGSPVKPFFLAHIGIELLLDQQLLHLQHVNPFTFYNQLKEANTPELKQFLEKAKIPDFEHFAIFYNKFISSRYLFDYAETVHVGYALEQICGRLWKSPFTRNQSRLLVKSLEAYQAQSAGQHLTIFNEIEQFLSPKKQ